MNFPLSILLPFAALLALSAPRASAQLTWSLADGSASWPADKRDAIAAAMNEAVTLYNAHGHFPKTLWANYNPGVPTAQASDSGWIDFGGSIGTRVAMHEISHTLGVGTVAAMEQKPLRKHLDRNIRQPVRPNSSTARLPPSTQTHSTSGPTA